LGGEILPAVNGEMIRHSFTLKHGEWDFFPCLMVKITPFRLHSVPCSKRAGRRSYCRCCCRCAQKERGRGAAAVAMLEKSGELVPLLLPLLPCSKRAGRKSRCRCCCCRRAQKERGGAVAAAVTAAVAVLEKSGEKGGGVVAAAVALRLKRGAYCVCAGHPLISRLAFSSLFHLLPPHPRVYCEPVVRLDGDVSLAFVLCVSLQAALSRTVCTNAYRDPNTNG